MRKKLASLLATIFFFLFLLPPATFAQEEITTNVIARYEIQESGIAQVKKDFTLINALSDLYATGYSFVLDNVKPADVTVWEEGKEHQISIEEREGATFVDIVFADAVVGKGESRLFHISYADARLATKTGEVWEITIPRLIKPESFTSYQAILSVPTSFGQEAFLSPRPVSKQDSPNASVYSFSKNLIADSGVVAAFGQFQVFDFDLTYHLENPLQHAAQTQIALPPDTAFQKVIYESIAPLPDQVHVDQDGNWLASYKLKPRQRVDVRAKGAVQLFAQEKDYPTPSASLLAENLTETGYWQTSDPQIASLARSLTTPKQIYDYLVATFSYNTDRVAPNVSRLGAAAALANPENAICMEFTDAFVALARAAGIPAREINGFAYSENPEIQPLSLVADVLHAWPEYWDEQRGVWVPIDPTWGNTTGGIDFFTKLDLRHFTFVIHGQSATYPFPAGSYKLGPNPQKDVFVNFGKLPAVRTSTPSLELAHTQSIPFFKTTYEIEIRNPGPVAVYGAQTQAFLDDEFVQLDSLEPLLPFSSQVIEVEVPFHPFGLGLAENLNIVLGEQRLTVSTHKTTLAITHIAFSLALLLIFVVVVLLKLKRLPFDLSRFRLKKPNP